jgi:hypothetical protein
MMEAVGTCETQVNVYQFTRHYNTEGSHLPIYYCVDTSLPLDKPAESCPKPHTVLASSRSLLVHTQTMLCNVTNFKKLPVETT